MGDSDDQDEPRSTGSRNKVAPMVGAEIPPGLAYLAPLGMIIVKQQHELAELICGCECQNSYLIKDQFGRDIFQAKEDSCCMTRQCCGPDRCFEMTIKNFQGAEVIHLQRPLRCRSCLFCCCLQKINVFSPPGNLIGSVKQTCTLCKPNFNVRNEMGEVVFKIKGPCCTSSCCGNDVSFNLFTPDGDTQVGRIAKTWGGILSEAFTDADNFGITFPVDLDVRMKATLIGACMLIDYMFFERGGGEAAGATGAAAGFLSAFF
ncbi:Phospholipid scramblase 2 [Orchesella cincta]|uniref:Phospholipid scramblase n=1 Tax=Orchesella cincta TaxID=48709 RepID=A0A1D2MQD5_ORCCI|nr:Phospholipid scramblase 2 [Orchesella cincta]